jgi:phage gpG-like protein
MSVRLTASGRPFARALTTSSLMREIGLLARTRIERRTRAGQAPGGRAFRPLSAGYAKQKAKALGHARADLTVSGRMLNDMQVVEVTDKSAALGFVSSGGGARGGTFIQRSRSVGANDKALYHQEAGRVLRPFFELSGEDEEAIAAAVERHLDQTFSD